MFNTDKITSTESISSAFTQLGIVSFEDACAYVRQLPYGRNTTRNNLMDVLAERKGTCSSKHAILRSLAHENRWYHIKLHLVIYAMSEANTPHIGLSLQNHELEYIPEAHCVLSVNGQFLDITNSTSDASNWESDVLSSREIEPADIVSNKILWHREFLDRWIELKDIDYNLDEIWDIRESCIEALSIPRPQ